VSLKRILVALLVLGSGCVSDHFLCHAPSDCIINGTQGTCEAVGACSITDSSCDSGRRYAAYASAGLSYTCVPDNGDMGACASGLFACGNACVALPTDDENCGACGVACTAGQRCAQGVCAATCASGFTACNTATCADLANDRNNCGACGHSCASGRCANGACDTTCDTTQTQCAVGAMTTLAGGDAYGVQNGVGSAAQLTAPYSIAIDNSGQVYIAELSDCSVRALDLATNTVRTFVGAITSCTSTDGTGSAVAFALPYDVTVDTSGNLYVADGPTGLIRQVALATGATRTLAGDPTTTGTADGVGSSAQFGGYVTGVAADASGNVYIADGSNATIRKLVVSTQAVTTIAGQALVPGTADGIGAAAAFENPGLLAFVGANLFEVDFSAIRVIRSNDANVTTLAGQDGVSEYIDGAASIARFDDPYGVAVDASGNIYTSEFRARTIRKISATGETSTLVGWPGAIPSYTDGVGANARLVEPRGMALDPTSGDLIVADGTALRRVALTNECVSLQSDIANCGACGHTCAAGEACVAGVCACPSATPDACGTGVAGFCATLATDPYDCGACNVVCASGHCAGGVCQPE
jgi:hypothetical protein